MMTQRAPHRRKEPRIARSCLTQAMAILVSCGVAAHATDKRTPAAGGDNQARQEQIDKMLLGYYQQMCVPKPLVVRTGEEWKAHRDRLRATVLRLVGLDPPPARIPLDLHESAPLDHPWCTVRRVAYQLWPGVYANGLLFMPKQFAERPAPAMLCPHGHWQDGNAHPEVQRRCLNLARLGYVTFSSTQHHFEDLYVGVSHQTLMIWNNMRALDLLESLPGVDRARIGVAGASGGGLQTQMLVGLDPRVKAATIVGLTCDFCEIMFFGSCHCACNHFPAVMRFTDHPEISTLGLPAAVQFVTMNDWTRTFEKNNFPTIRTLYAAHGVADRVQCLYFDTPHTYDKPKREQTYAWMEHWLRGKPLTGPVMEPETQVFPLETVANLKAAAPGDKGFGEISRIWRRERGYQTPTLAKPADWQAYRDRMTAALRELLGEEAQLPRKPAASVAVKTEVRHDLTLQRVDWPSEGGLVVPAVVLRKTSGTGKLPVTVMLGATGKEALLGEKGAGSPTELARAGSLVVLPDVRFVGEFSFAGNKNAAQQRQAWERNGIVWGRPVPGMTCTDLRAVLDALAERPDADIARVHVVARGSGDLGVAVLFAAALDLRITSADVDLAGCSFEKRSLPLVSSVLQHGDVLQWAALLADRTLTLRNIPPEAGTTAWLGAAFAANGHAQGLKIEK